MNHIRLLMALVAACILVMPALSMPNNEMGQEQKQCICPNSLKDCTQMCPGQDGKEKSSGCQKSMMGEDGKQMGEGQDGKEKTSGCQKSMMGEDGKQMGEGQDGKEKSSGCQKSMMGEDGKTMGHKPIKSMMGDKGREDNVEVKIVIINVNT
jgi:hypothetical protein